METEILKVALFKILLKGTSLVVQWLGLHVSTAGSMGSTPGWGTKILQAMWHGQKKRR